MQSNTLLNLSKALIAVVLLSACAKTNYDGAPRIHPFENKLQQPPVQTPPTVQGTPVTITDLPVLSFVQKEVTMDGQLVARLELQLSRASTSPVTAVVKLVDATAKHFRDYAGFKGNMAETSRTIVIPPGQTRIALPDIGGKTTRFCDTYFNAKLNPNNVQQAKVVDDTAKVNVPCSDAYPTDPEPPVVVPEPPVIVPPVIEPPCPPVLVQAPVEARFEHESMKMREHSRRAEVEIELDLKSSLPVTIDIQTEDGTATAGQDYHPLKIQVVIPAGKTEIKVAVDLIGGHKCRAPNQGGDEARYEFSVVATQIANANMQRPEVKISIQKDVDDCK